MDQTRIIKIVTLGDSSVGKTSLIRRYINEEFHAANPPTMGIDFVEKKVNYGGETIKLQIWDTAGQEKFHAVSKIYYQKADVVLLMYDITAAESFTTLKNWDEEVRANTKKDVLRVIVGNKIDLITEEQVDQKTASTYAKEAKALFSLTSAKEDTGVNQLFQNIVEKM